MTANQKNQTSFVKFNLTNDAHLAFYKTLFKQTYKSKLLSWQYAHLSPNTDCLIFTESDEMIGFNGITKLRAIYNGSEVNVLWSGDFIVKKEFRGKGYGKSLKILLKEKFEDEIVMSLGISKGAYKILTSLGWQGVSEHESLVETFQYVGSQQSLRIKGIGISALQLLHKITAKLKGEKLAHNNFIVKHDFVLPERNLVDALWSSVKDSYTNIVIRDFDYLHKRYIENPLAAHTYSYLSLYEQGRLVAILIYRKDGYSLNIADYLGPQQSLEVKTHLINYINNNNPLHVITLTTNDLEFKSIVKGFGYLKKNADRKFLVRDGTNKNAASNWFLMAGDSDGELLGAAQATSKSKYHFAIYNMDEFKAIRTSWSTLLLRSRANPLFMSWEWVFAWWSTWGSKLGLTLHLVIVFDGREMVGIAPLYSERFNRFMPWLGNSMQFIGNHWEKTATVRSEYINPIIHNHDSSSITRFLAEVLKNNKSIITIDIPDICISRENNSFELIRHLKKTQDFTRIMRSKNFGYKLFTDSSLNEYTAKLGRNTRASYFNKLSKAQSFGLIYKQNELHHNEFITVLNEFHKHRWGKKVFENDAYNFQLTLAELLASSSHLHFLNSVIMDNDDIVSCSYNIVANNDVYNIQSGFKEDFGNALSLGKIHFGFLINDCFQAEDVHSLDFLIGHGKHSNYKENLQTTKINFVSVSVYRKSFVGSMIKWHLLISNYMRSFAKTLFRD